MTSPLLIDESTPTSATETDTDVLPDLDLPPAFEENFKALEQYDELTGGYLSDRDSGDWFAISTEPWPCPRKCGAPPAVFITAAHLVVVFRSAWFGNDDVLEMLSLAKQHGRNPRRVPAPDPMQVACISFMKWIELGRPVCGVKKV